METIESGKVVELAYTLSNEAGEVLDQADQKDPFAYIHGADQIVPGLESALEGGKVGDKKKVKVLPKDGYGEVREDLKVSVKRTQFPENVKLQPGMQFESQDADGNGIIFTVESVEGDQVKIDGNHPMAGQTLHFEVEVLNIREATEEEMNHGHVHGAGGHHH